MSLAKGQEILTQSSIYNLACGDDARAVAMRRKRRIPCRKVAGSNLGTDPCFFGREIFVKISGFNVLDHFYHFNDERDA